MATFDGIVMNHKNPKYSYGEIPKVVNTANLIKIVSWSEIYIALVVRR